jgi:aminoglycoside phosphotransferase
MFYDPLNGPHEPASAILEIIDGRAFDTIWVNGLGGVTIALLDSPRTFIKWSPIDTGLNLLTEAEKLDWAGAFTPVPLVIDRGHDEQGTWLVTRAIEGENAASPRWRHDPAIAAKAVGEGLRAMHDALPVASCPYTWSADERVDAARERFRRGERTRIDVTDWNKEFASVDIDQLIKEAEATTPEEDLVVCHGDACVPNTLLAESGNWIAHVDLGSLGLGDRWADLAVASWSTVWNYGPGWEQTVFDAYGIESDAQKLRYYRLLWELG